jgi:hypothetical protein
MKRLWLLVLLAFPLSGFAQVKKLDNLPRAQDAGWEWINETTPKQFRKMQRAYHPESFDRWVEKLQRVRAGMKFEDALKILSPIDDVPWPLITNDGQIHTVVLDDAYYVGLMVDTKSKRLLWDGGTPVAMAYRILSGKAPR